MPQHEVSVPLRYKSALYKAIQEADATIRRYDDRNGHVTVTTDKPVERPVPAWERHDWVRKVA